MKLREIPLHGKTVSVDEDAADAFHSHLDVCVQCEEHPFQLCRLGDKLLRSIVPPEETSKTV